MLLESEVWKSCIWSCSKIVFLESVMFIEPTACGKGGRFEILLLFCHSYGVEQGLCEGSPGALASTKLRGISGLCEQLSFSRRILLHGDSFQSLLVLWIFIMKIMKLCELVAEHFWYICLLGLLASRRFMATRYKFKRSTYIQEPWVIGGVVYRERN
jgi:hypothetical protein